MTEAEIDEMKKELILLRSQREKTEEEFTKMRAMIQQLYSDLANSDMAETETSSGDCAKAILETVLVQSETGGVRGSPLQYNHETGGWAFWDETDTNLSNEYPTIDEALVQFAHYCDYLDSQTTKGGETA